MFKILISLFCLLFIQQSLQEDPAPCEPRKCCIPEVGTFNIGELVSDPNGICQQYICRNGGYAIYNCPVFSDECIVEAGTPGALFPDCCSQLATGKSQPAGCTAVA